MRDVLANKRFTIRITIQVSRVQDILSPNVINYASDTRSDMRMNWNECNEVTSSTVYAHLTAVNNMCFFARKGVLTQFLDPSHLLGKFPKYY
jgi:hypothetical protein